METPQNNDVKPPESVPSTPPTDVTPAPSTEGVTPAPPAEPAANAPVTNDQIIDEVFKKHGVADPATAEKPEAPDPEKPGETPPVKEEGAAAKPPEKAKETVTEAPVEFAKHPAWKRIIGERDEARAQVTAVKKSADIHEGNVRWMQANGIAPQEHVQVMTAYAECRKAGVEPAQLNELLAWRRLAETDVDKALEMGHKALKYIAERSGRALPTDLQGAVDRGEITEQLAKQYHQQALKASQVDQLQESGTRAQQEHAQALVTNAVSNWITQKQTTNPSYRESETGKTGLWEVVAAFVNQMASEKIGQLNRALKPQEMVEVCERAYNQAAAFTSRHDPKPPAKKPPFGTSSRNNTDPKPKFEDNDSLIDAAMTLQAERG